MKVQINKDISEIRQILEQDINEDYSSTHINIQYPAINTQASIQPQINNEPCLNNGIPSDTQVTHVPASFCNICNCTQQAEPRQIINNREILTQLLSNAETCGLYRIIMKIITTTILPLQLDKLMFNILMKSCKFNLKGETMGRNNVER